MLAKSDIWVLFASLSAVVVGLVACDGVWPPKPARPMSIPRDQTSLVPSTTPSPGPLIGAITRRVPIRSGPSPAASLLGLLTAGATLRRSQAAVGHDGCPGGWYSVSPRGYLCLDDQTTIDPRHPTLQARDLLANREAPLPYPYAMARHAISVFEPDPKHQDGVRERGRLEKGSTFAIVGSWETLDDYDQRQRLAMLTHGVFVPTRDIEPIEFDRGPGFAIDVTAQRLPLGLPLTPKTHFYRFADTRPTTQGFLDAGKPIALTVKSRTFESQRYLQLTNDTYVAERDLAVVRQRQEFPDFATPPTHWVDVDLSQGVIVMYTGERPSYVTRTRTRPTDSVRRGTAWVKAKQVTELTSTAASNQKGRADYDSPWVVEFDSGLTMRAAIGPAVAERLATHQELELYPEDAARLFRFVEPNLPEGWHAVAVSDPRHEGSPMLLH